MLGVLPPALWIAKGFLVGEAYDHAICKVTRVVMVRYTALIQYRGRKTTRR